MYDEALMLLAKDVRGKTLRILEGIDESQAQFKAPGLNNSILWHAGHAVVVVEHLTVSAATGAPPGYPRGWFEIFSWKSDPTTVTTWPKLAEVKEKLVEQLAKVTAIIEGLKPDELAKVIDPNRGRTLRWSILHGFHDEANHQGEMWLLKKLLMREGGSAIT